MLRFSNPDTFTPAPLYSSELRYILEKLRSYGKWKTLDNFFKIGVLVAGGYSSSYLNSTEVYRYATHQPFTQQVSWMLQQRKSFWFQAFC